MMRHLTKPPPPPSRANPALSPAVEQVILKVLSKPPADRYQTAGEMVTALEKALAGMTPSASRAEEKAPAPGIALPVGPKAPRAIPFPPPSLIEEEEEAPRAASQVEKKPEWEGIRNFLVGLMALFTAALTLLEKFLRAVDILRNPLVGFIVVGVAVDAMVISAGYVLARPRLYKRWQRRLAAVELVLTVLAAAGWGGWTVYDMTRPPKGLIVLIADFEREPGAQAVNYAQEIEDGLVEALEKLKVEGIYVERAYEVYTDKDARSRAAARKAAVVIYGRYDDRTVRPRFELVKALQQYLPALKQGTLKLAALERLETWLSREFKEMTYIALSAIGLAYYADGQNAKALILFDQALESLPADTQLNPISDFELRIAPPRLLGGVADGNRGILRLPIRIPKSEFRNPKAVIPTIFVACC
jgi:hypothetical protein